IMFVCCYLLGSVMTQIANATLLVVSASKQKVILAADSRAVIDLDRYIDTFCKIDVLNSKLVFSAVGLVADMHQSLPEDARFNVFAIARKSASEYRYDPESISSPYDSVKEIAKMWGR